MSNLDFKNLSYLKLLLKVEGVGPQKIFSLLSKFSSIEEVFHASQEKLINVNGINKTLATKIRSASDSLSKAKNDLEETINRIDALGGQILSYWDEEYPEPLKKIYFPPLIIFTLGKFTAAD